MLRSLKLDAKALEQKAGYGRYSYWRDLLEDETKSFGEKAARKVEAGLGLPDGWLDQDERDAVQSVAKQIPARVSAPAPAESEQQLLVALEDWRLKASSRSQQVLDNLILLAQKNELRDEDWLLIEQMAARMRRK